MESIIPKNRRDKNRTKKPNYDNRQEGSKKNNQKIK